MKLQKSHSRRIGTAALALIVSCGAFLLNVATGRCSCAPGPARSMIVMLRNQNSLARTAFGRSNAAVKAEQAPISVATRERRNAHFLS